MYVTRHPCNPTHGPDRGHSAPDIFIMDRIAAARATRCSCRRTSRATSRKSHSPTCGSTATSRQACPAQLSIRCVRAGVGVPLCVFKVCGRFFGLANPPGADFGGRTTGFLLMGHVDCPQLLDTANLGQPVHQDGELESRADVGLL